MELPLSAKQWEFIINSTAKINIAHGPVRSGKTIGTLFRFMQAVNSCPDSKIWMVGHTHETLYRNAVRLLLEPEDDKDPLSIFQPFLTWFPGKRELRFKTKTISIIGAKDEGSLKKFHGPTFSLVYCDEITLYPESIIDMIDTRLSKGHSTLFCSCNPSFPDHKVKKWIDKAEAKDKNYYALQFMLEDNPFVDEGYKKRIKDSLTGLFYKRNYLGLWCMAEGAIFDFFDKAIHVKKKPPIAAEYWVAGIDYGTSNPFCCLLIGVNTGVPTQQGKQIWVEKEYYWDPKVKGRQKTNSEFADDVQEFLEPYGVRSIYLDPSAEAFQLELRRRGMHAVHANNNVEYGIQVMTDEMNSGNLTVCNCCPNLIREIEGYVWDNKAAEKGEDEPQKKNDHAVDALRYVMATHKVCVYDPYKHERRQEDFLRYRYGVSR